MLRIDKNEKKLTRLKQSPLAQTDHWERHLQEMICSNPDAFCEEIGERLCLIGQEVRPSDAISDRIDILAVDEEGHSVVLELKRGSHKLQLLQAVSYAGMVSRWSAERFIETLAENFGLSKSDARNKIMDHIASETFNHAQRIVLIAEDFDPALLIGAEWLHENFGVDVRCYRLQLSLEDEKSYLTCTCIYPPLEIASLTRGSDTRVAQEPDADWTSWPEALDSVENPALKEFAKTELANNRENRLAYRELIYRIAGKRRLWAVCRKRYAYVFQWGRFSGDLEYWRNLLSEPDHVEEVRGGRALRFHLTTAADFAAFSDAATRQLVNVAFSEDPDKAPVDDA
ncbi:MAG TPA: hypothetical protein VHC39_14125 [Rhizomicrobium sp.]|nr:hypothetical protein [Rhizomicrobium sp.]